MREIEKANQPNTLDRDLAELESGTSLSRHAWLQDILDNPAVGPNSYGQNPPRDVCLRAMIARINELSRLPQRDSELELATVELGRRFTSGPMYDGGSSVYEWVRATEVYEDLRTDMERYHKAEPKIVRSDIAGIGGFYAGYAQGSQIEGISEEDNDRWFMTFGASGLCVHVPFDSITEVVDSSSRFYLGDDGQQYRYGAVIESPTDRSGMFNHWEQLEAAA